MCIQYQFQFTGIQSEVLIYQLKLDMRLSELKHTSLSAHAFNTRSFEGPSMFERCETDYCLASPQRTL
jgi:hypothetical protein